MRLLLRPILGHLRGKTTEFHMNAILPIVSYTANGVSFLIQFAYRLKAHTLRR